MNKKLATVVFLFLSSPFAFANPCYVDSGDGEINPQKITYAVEFSGPSNPFWSYVSDQADAWSFKIAQKGTPHGQVPVFETFSVKLPQNKTLDLKNDLDFKSKSEFRIKPAKVKEIIDVYRGFIEDYRKKNPNKLPAATQQILQFYISFKSPSGNADEAWLNHHCSIGLGLNQLTVDLEPQSKAQKPVHLKFEVEVNQPDLGSAEYGAILPAKFQVQAQSGVANIKGLPVGTYIAKLETNPNAAAPVSYMWSISKNCKLLLKKESETRWSIAENTCSRG